MNGPIPNGDAAPQPVKILVVDDDEAVRRNFCAGLQDLGYETTKAADGREGLELFEQEAPDLVLVDLFMPVMSGLELIAALKVKSAVTPLIVVSGSGTLYDAIKAIRLGAWDYVVKPVENSDELDLVLRRNLDRARLLVVNQRQKKQLEDLLAQRTNKLEESEERIRRLSDHLPNSMICQFARNPDGTTYFLHVSAGIEKLNGLSASAVLADSSRFYDQVLREDFPILKSARDKSATEMCAVNVNVRMRRADGELRWMNLRSAPRLLPDGRMVWDAIETDITERIRVEEAHARLASREKLLETELRQAQKMEAIGQLAGGIAHDFNNILSSLIMQTELVEMVKALPPEALDGLKEIRADANRAAELTRQLLLFSRRQVMQPRILDLNELIINLGKMLQRIIREDVRLHLHLHPKPLLIRADPGMLEQVLMNLVVNARDAMPTGGELNIETSEASVDGEAAHLNPDALPGRYVCFDVRDTGGGIPPAVVPKIFEPFFTTKEAGKGTGLGLATVFGIVKQHQGWINMDNRPGEGVTFRIFLPVSTVTAAELSPADVKPKPRGGTETIFLVEDDPGVRKLARKLLERRGYQVVEAANGVEALTCWVEHRGKVALLLTDLVMPGGISGQELARRLHADQPQIKVVYASGYSADIAGREFQMRDGEAFIQKPFAPDQLWEIVRRSLDG